MMRRIAPACITALLIPLLSLSACRKQEAPRTMTSPPAPQEQAHEKEMLKKSFEESKRVVAAKVNGEPISEFSVLREMNAIAPQYLASGQKPTPELNAKIRKDALNTLVIQALA